MSALSRFRSFTTAIAAWLLILAGERPAQAKRVVDFVIGEVPYGGNFINHPEAPTCTYDDSINDRVANCIWSVVKSGDTCAGGAPQTFENAESTSVTSDRAGKYTIYLHVTYVGDENNPSVPAPEPTDLSHTITWKSANSVYYDGSVYDMNPYPANAGPVVFLLLGVNELPTSGMNYTLHERISYTIPASQAPEFNGGWSVPNETPVLHLNENGVIGDVKTSLGIGGDADGDVFYQCTHVLGVKYLDLCGVTRGPDPIVTLTVKHIRVSPTTYRVDVTCQ